MSKQTTATKALNVGRWTQFRPLTKKDREVFNEASKGIFGHDYTPLEVSIQLLNGTNYRFKCSVSLPPTKIIYEATVDIHEPIGEKPTITASQKTSGDSEKSTEKKWPKDQPLTADECALFDAAISAIVGITYSLN